MSKSKSGNTKPKTKRVTKVPIVPQADLPPDRIRASMLDILSGIAEPDQPKESLSAYDPESDRRQIGVLPLRMYEAKLHLDAFVERLKPFFEKLIALNVKYQKLIEKLKAATDPNDAKVQAVFQKNVAKIKAEITLLEASTGKDAALFRHEQAAWIHIFLGLYPEVENFGDVSIHANGIISLPTTVEHPMTRAVLQVLSAHDGAQEMSAAKSQSEADQQSASADAAGENVDMQRMKAFGMTHALEFAGVAQDDDEEDEDQEDDDEDPDERSAGAQSHQSRFGMTTPFPAQVGKGLFSARPKQGFRNMILPAMLVANSQLEHAKSLKAAKTP